MKAALAAVAGLACALGLGGCGGGTEEEAPPAPTPTVDAGPRTLVAADLDLDALGARIDGPQGPEVESEVPGLGTMVSYVACPAVRGSDASDDGAGGAGATDIEQACEPEALPQDTRYTYVHRVTLSEAQGEDGPAGATLFRTSQPAPGFANVIGFSREQAAEALGPGGNIRVQLENGRLIWRIAAGDGWMPGETLTFFWQSTLPPAGPREAYMLETSGESGAATGPFPEDEPEETAGAG